MGAQDHIRAYQAGKLELVPGCNLEQSLESTVMGALNRIRNEASEARAAAGRGCRCVRKMLMSSKSATRLHRHLQWELSRVGGRLLSGNWVHKRT